MDRFAKQNQGNIRVPLHALKNDDTKNFQVWCNSIDEQDECAIENDERRFEIGYDEDMICKAIETIEKE